MIEFKFVILLFFCLFHPIFFLSFVCPPPPFPRINLVFFIISSYLLYCFIICTFVLWFIFSGCFGVYSILFLSVYFHSYNFFLCKNLTTLYRFSTFPFRVFVLSLAKVLLLRILQYARCIIIFTRNSKLLLEYFNDRIVFYISLYFTIFVAFHSLVYSGLV